MNRVMETTPFLTPPGHSYASAVEAFEALDHAHQQLVAAETAELIAIVAAADLYQVDQQVAWNG